MMKLLTPAVALLFFSACGKKVTPLELKKYVENPENGYVQTADAGTYKIRCVYTPAEYLTVQSFRTNDIRKNDFLERKAEFDKADMYQLQITSSDAQAIPALTEYFNFYMQENIVKVCGTDTIPCMAYMAEPFNAVDHKQHIGFGFENKACAGEEYIFIQNSPMSAAPIRFSFHKNELTIPSITLN